MSELILPNFGNGADVLSSVLFFVGLLFGFGLIYGIMLKTTFKKKAYILNPKTMKIEKIVKYKSVVSGDTSEIQLDDNIIKLVLDKNVKLHPNTLADLSEEIWLIKVSENEYRFAKIDIDNEILKVIYNDKEKLAREKFIKQHRLGFQRWATLSDKIEKFAPYILIAIIAFASILIYDGMNKTQIKISEINTNALNKALEHDKNYLNGTYMIEYCKTLNQFVYNQYQTINTIPIRNTTIYS